MLCVRESVGSWVVGGLKYGRAIVSNSKGSGRSEMHASQVARVSIVPHVRLEGVASPAPRKFHFDHLVRPMRVPMHLDRA